jgi:glycosyltransferase involved in cell wall biosynthesis
MENEIDIIMGIPTYNEAENIGFVVKQVDLGLRKHYPDKKALIVACDGNSTDRTKPVFLNTETLSEKLFLTTEQRGKGNGFKMLFELVAKVKPKATMVVDADLKSINEEWTRLLIGPILKDYDYVTPVYVRERYDGTITNHIAYPLVYALLGKNIRQPIAGDFAFSTNLAEYWLRKWSPEAEKFGIDIFMTTHAIIGGFKTCQASLGTKIHKPSAPRLSEMFSQVVGALFETITEDRNKWIGNGMEEQKIYGIKTLPEPRNLKPNPEEILQTAVSIYQKDMLKKYLSQENFEKINSMFFNRQIDIDPELWARVVYDLILSFHSGAKEEVVESLKSLYFARVYTFFKKIPEYTTEEVEKEILEQAKCFRDMRGYLTERLN